MTEKFKSLQHFVDWGGDLTSCIREETLLLHASLVSNNTMEGRIMGTIVLPDDSCWEVERVIKLRFKKKRAGREVTDGD